MNFGAHLPLMDFGGNPFTLSHLTSFTQTAADLGFDAVSVNDHLVFSVPWLDGPSALAAVLERSGDMTLATTIALGVVRGPVPLAKTLSAIDVLSGGRLVVGIGPGSSAQDYEAVGLNFAERWPRFDEAIQAVRALLQADEAPFIGRFHSTDGIDLQPRLRRSDGPPIWVGSWGSDAGMRRVARLGDGWLASAYNTTPEIYAQACESLRALLSAQGKDVDTFSKALATMWCYITDDRAEAERVVRERLIKAVHRPEDVLRERLPIGPPELFAEKLTAYARAGVEQVFIWPIADEVHQLELFWDKVRPLVTS